jgi:predicted O-methyltransferase YrrM
MHTLAVSSGAEKVHVEGGKMAEDGTHSSYTHPNCTFGDILTSVTFAVAPKRIVEFGILDGYSLAVFDRATSDACKIEAYDIFEKFLGNGARKPVLDARFGHRMPKVSIAEGDFFDSPTMFTDGTIDLIHVDIANTGAVFRFAVEKLLSKLRPNGVMLLEGGTPARDQVPWMLKYNKTPIVPYIEELKSTPGVQVVVLGDFPGITLVRKA